MVLVDGHIVFRIERQYGLSVGIPGGLSMGISGGGCGGGRRVNAINGCRMVSDV